MPLPSSRDREQVRRGLAEWLTGKVAAPVTVGEVTIPDGAGFSSETFLFDAEWSGGGGRFVTRMGPVATDYPVFPSYDLSLQVDAMALVRARSDVPVPTVRWYEPDDAPLGGEFYIMDRIEGISAPDNPPYVFGSWLTESSPEQLRAVQDHTAAVMAGIHAIELDEAAVAFLSRDEHGSTPLDQHLRYQRWYYDWAREGVDYPIIGEALDWLEARRPTDDPVGMNWGDARIGNIMFHDYEPVAVVDWEMACLGAPEADVSWQLALHHFFVDILDVMGMDDPFPHFFAVDDFVGSYEQAAGRPIDRDDLYWYYAFAHLRFGIVTIRTSVRAIATGEVEEPDDPGSIISNARLIRATMDGTNPYWH